MNLIFPIWSFSVILIFIFILYQGREIRGSVSGEGRGGGGRKTVHVRRGSVLVMRVEVVGGGRTVYVRRGSVNGGSRGRQYI